MRPVINPNWEVIPNVQPLLKLTRANLTIGRLGTISARGIVEEAANPIIQREAAKLGPQVVKELNLKEDVQKLWNEAHVVEKINEDPAAWIIFDPNSISLGPFDYSNPLTVSVTLGMTAQSFVSNTETNAPAPEALPNLKLVQKNPENNIRIPIVANLKELNVALKEETLEIDTKVGAKVKITEPEVRVGQGGKLNFSIDVEAGGGAWGRGISGRIWLEGRPIVDYEKQTLGFTEVSMTVETRQALSNAAAWLLDELLVKAIERELRADLNDYVPELEEEIQKFLNSGQLPEDINVIVQQPRVELLDVYTITRAAKGSPPDPGIVVVLGGKGKVTVRLASLP